MSAVESPAKPGACQSCGVKSRDLVLETVGLPTAHLRREAVRAGLPEEVPMWVCSDAQGCLHRLLSRGRA